MHACKSWKIVLTQGRTVQNGGSKPPNTPSKSHHATTQRRSRHCMNTQWSRKAGAEGAGRPGDTISMGDTKRKKIINFLGKMVENIFWGVKWLKKVSGKFCVINYMLLRKRLKKSSEMFGMNSVFECRRLKIAKFLL